MRTDGLTVYEYMEDFDNAELNGSDRLEQLRDAVIKYNEEYGTSHDPKRTLSEYRFKIKQQDE